MLINEVINKIKKQCAGYGRIDDDKTRDKVLFGSTDRECSGIVFCLWATKDVIEKAHKQGANLIISHEALFWNHGDHTDWLEESNNQTYSMKKSLLDKYELTVWRLHDYIHSGIEVEDGKIQDGIFYGLAKKLSWSKYLTFEKPFTASFNIPKSSANKVIDYVLNRLNLKEAREIGSLNHDVTKIVIPFHILDQANEEIKAINNENIGLLITMEMNDFTLAQYVYDNSDFTGKTAILSLGHFNVEQPGMEFAAYYFGKLLDININFLDIGDYYNYINI